MNSVAREASRHTGICQSISALSVLCFVQIPYNIISKYYSPESEEVVWKKGEKEEEEKFQFMDEGSWEPLNLSGIEQGPPCQPPFNTGLIL